MSTCNSNDKAALLSRNPIWPFFDQITRVPRPSKHEEKIVAYLLDFAKQRGLSAKQDKVGNTLISVPATKGGECLDPVILQAHVDMVCEKNANVTIDFLSDPIDYYVKDGWVRARGTTLGADDGLGVALALAVVDEGLKGGLVHGPLYCLFTIDEETGLTGAYGIETDFLPAAKLINLDSEDEGQIFVGCAGGCSTVAEFPIEKEVLADGYLGIEITLGGLLGGHSGGDIHLGRANANKLMARFVALASEKCGFRLATFNGGNLHNAIAREAKVQGAVPFALKETIRTELNCFVAEVEEEYEGVEPTINFDLGTTQTPNEVLTLELQNRLIKSLLAAPHGVLANSHVIDNLVQTSTNLASVKMHEGVVRIETSQRSSIESEKVFAQQMVSSVFELSGAKVMVTDGYPGWRPNTKSGLLAKACESYRTLFGKEAHVLAIHAGLECGLFLDKRHDLDMISVGPTLRGVHSPDEAVDIESVDKFWVFLIDLLKR